MERYLKQFEDWMKLSNMCFKKPLKELKALSRIANIFGYTIKYDIVNNKIYISKTKKFG